MEEGAEGSQEGQAGPPDVLTDDTPTDVPASDVSASDSPPADRPAGDRRHWFAAAEYLGAAVVALWLTRSFWLPGRFVVGFDTVAYTGPNYAVTMDAWRSGRMPLWNEFIYGGVTHAGNPQAAIFSPTKVIGLLFDPNRAMGVTVALHLVVMAIGTVALLRRLGGRAPAGFAAAVVMVANGAVLTRTIQFEQIVVLAWTPLLLCALTAVVWSGRRPWLAMAAIGGVTAMVLVAGHPQVVYQVVVIAGAWTVALVVAAARRADDGRTRVDWRRVADVAIGLAAGVTAASVQLVGVLAATRDSAIGTTLDLDDLRSPLLSSRPDVLAQILLGSVRGVDEPMFAGGFESVGHVGVAAAFVAVVGVVLAWAGGVRADRGRRTIAVALSVLAVLGVVWSLGPRTPLFHIAFEWLPGFDLARASGRWINLTVIAVAIAVGLAVDALRDRPRTLVAAGAASAMFGITLLLGALEVVILPDRATLLPWVIVAVLVALAVVAAGDTVTVSRWPTAALVAVVALVVVELGATSRYSTVDANTRDTAFDAHPAGPAGELEGRAGLSIAFTDDAFGDPPYLVGGFRPNTNALARVRSLDGYDGGVQLTERFAELVRRVSPSPVIDLPLRNNVPIPFTPDVAAELGIRFVVLDNRRPPGDIVPGWIPTNLRDDTFGVWENPAWTADAVLYGADGSTTSLTVTSDRAEHLEIHLDPAQGITAGGTLVVHRQVAPGWTAAIDGRTAPLADGDGFFLTLDVPSGATTVELRYQPRWLAAGISLSLAGTLGLTAMAVTGLRRRRSLRSDPIGADTGVPDPEPE